MKTSTAERLIWFLSAITVILVCSTAAWATGGTPPRPTPSGDSSASADASADASASVKIGDTSVTVPVTQGSVTGGTMHGGDVTVGGDKNRAYAFANSLGDVDIAGCLGSTQWNTPLFGKQKLVLNWPCMTEFYLRNEMYANAAMAICNTEIRKEYETEEDCRAAHPFKAMALAPMPTESHDEDEEHERLEAEIAALRADLSAAKEKARKATLEARYAVREAQKQPEKVEYGLSDEQVAELTEWEQRWEK